MDTWGPPPLARITQLLFEMNAYDIDVRVNHEGRALLAPLVHPHERSAGGEVICDDRVRVSCCVVPHPEVTPAFAYRFDTPGRSVVISGDTAKSDALIALARASRGGSSSAGTSWKSRRAAASS